jgi:predicted nuclease of predicted toxin-antitoxin system
VRLLLDGSFAPSLVGRLADVYPESMHVQIGQHPTPDRTLIQLAGLMDSVIVTMSSDFDDLVLLEPEAGQALRLDVGPLSTDEAEVVLRSLATRLPALFAESRLVLVSSRT